MRALLQSARDDRGGSWPLTGRIAVVIKHDVAPRAVVDLVKIAPSELGRQRPCATNARLRSAV